MFRVVLRGSLVAGLLVVASAAQDPPDIAVLRELPLGPAVDEGLTVTVTDSSGTPQAGAYVVRLPGQDDPQAVAMQTWLQQAQPKFGADRRALMRAAFERFGKRYRCGDDGRVAVPAHGTM